MEFIQWYVHITTVDCWPMPYLKCSDRTYFFREFSSNAFSPTLELVLQLFDSWCRVWSSSSDVHITTIDCWPMPYLKCSGRMLFSILFSGILFKWILPNCSSWFSFTFIWQLMPGVEFIQWCAHYYNRLLAHAVPEMIWQNTFFGNSLSVHSTQLLISFYIYLTADVGFGVYPVIWTLYYSRLLAHAVPEMFW